MACLEKTMNKIVKNQTADGQFAGNGGWAPVLSVAVANKGIARAQQNGVKVDRQVLRPGRRAIAPVRDGHCRGRPATAVAGTAAVSAATPRPPPARSQRHPVCRDLRASERLGLGRSRRQKR